MKRLRWVAHPLIRLPVLFLIYLGYGNFRSFEPQQLRAVAKNESAKAVSAKAVAGPAPGPSAAPSGDCMSSSPSSKVKRKLLDTDDETCLVPKRPRSEAAPKDSH